MISRNSENIRIEGRMGAWYAIDEQDTERHGLIFLLEHEMYGDDAACLIVDKDGKLLLDDVWNGFDDYEEWIAGQEEE